MDVNFIANDYQFIFRTSALIFNKDLDKVLLFNVEGRNFYLLPGGKVQKLDSSLNSLKREMLEELGEYYSNIDFEFLGVSEEFVNAKGLDNHQINIIYKGIYKKEIVKKKFKGLEGNWINFEWMDIEDLNDINIFPSKIKEIIKNSNCKYHFVEDLIRK